MNGAINIFKLNIKIVFNSLTGQFRGVTQEQEKIAGNGKQDLVLWFFYHFFLKQMKVI
jgi:hypothetical protein